MANDIVVRAPELPRDFVWLNTERPLSLRELRGQLVILDFWTYCCINCIHILPELKKLERQFPNNLVVIGILLASGAAPAVRCFLLTDQFLFDLARDLSGE